MKITTILALLLLLTPFLGMFYWMYKSKNEELNLSTNSWHFKLLQYMWDTETYEVKNACPYYWGLVSSIILLIPYLVIRYMVIFPISKIPFNKIPKIKLPKLHISEKIDKNIPKINIPESKKQWFKLLYTKGKTIFTWVICGICGITVLYGLFKIAPFYTAISILSVLLFVIFTVLLHIFKDEWDKYHIEHYGNFFKGLVGILSIPFIIIFAIIKLIFGKITKVYYDNCPPINWN